MSTLETTSTCLVKDEAAQAAVVHAQVLRDPVFAVGAAEKDLRPEQQKRREFFKRANFNPKTPFDK